MVKQKVDIGMMSPNLAFVFLLSHFLQVVVATFQIHGGFHWLSVKCHFFDATEFQWQFVIDMRFILYRMNI